MAWNIGSNGWRVTFNKIQIQIQIQILYINIYITKR